MKKALKSKFLQFPHDQIFHFSTLLTYQSVKKREIHHHAKSFVKSIYSEVKHPLELKVYQSSPKSGKIKEDLQLSSP